MYVVLLELIWTFDFEFNHQFFGIAPHRVETAAVALTSLAALDLCVVVEKQLTFEAQSSRLLSILEVGPATGASG